MEFEAGKIDTKGRLLLVCPSDWIAIWKTWENEKNLDVIADWKLYQNGAAVNGAGTEGARLTDGTTIEFSLLFSRLDQLDNLTLVPEYSQTGEHPDEAISIEKIIK